MPKYGSRTRDTRMDQGTGCGAHHMVERRNLRQRNRSAAERYEKCSHRQSLPPPTAEAPAVVSESIGRPECHPTGATGSGNVQLATRRDGRRRFSLLRCCGCPRETLLSDALQSGLSTGSQEPKGCCGRLTHGSWQEVGFKRHFARLSIHFEESWRSPASITISSRSGSTGGQSRHHSAHHKEVALSAIAQGTADASAMHSTIAVVQYMIRSLRTLRRVNWKSSAAIEAHYPIAGPFHALSAAKQAYFRGCSYGLRRQ